MLKMYAVEVISSIIIALNNFFTLLVQKHLQKNLISVGNLILFMKYDKWDNKNDSTNLKFV